MDASGHSTLAEWTVEEGYDDAVEQFRRQLEEGWIAVRDEGEGRATQLTELPREADLVILRRPIAGG